MRKRLLSLMAILAGLYGPVHAVGQTACGNTKLVCLIPTVLHTTSSTFNFVNTAFGTQISQLELPSRASGITFSLDRVLGVYTVSQESFGPVLAERAETVGRNRAYFAFTYQRFGFSQIDSNKLNNLSILFFFPTSQNPQVVTNPSTRIDAAVNQYVASGTFGITDHLDVSIAVPFAGVSMAVSSKGTEYSAISNATANFSEFLNGAASGPGDVVLSAKSNLYRHERYGIAVGGELRLPSGDAQNFLGSGAYGIEPYVVLSHHGRITPHLDLAYQWNSHSVLAGNEEGKEDPLPRDFRYDAGVDAGVTKRITVVTDLLGRLYFNAPQISTPRKITTTVDNQPLSFTSVQKIQGSYNADNLAVGVKANPWNNLLLTANVMIKLNDGGLRATVVPLAGISYSF